jgi:DNA (cytosine-5)-methyltransferase 1
MTAYYNEIDPYAAQWLRNLIDAGHIAPGDVDERSIADVSADDLRSYTQAHFFAGIGGWSIALRLAGWSDDRPVWTGSCPCQPFSAAGAGKAADDVRHLWPAWFPLIRELAPPTIFGEQVEAAVGWGWLDAVFADLEIEGYACGATVLPACSVGAPHIRQRLWFVADASSERYQSQRGGVAGAYSQARPKPIIRAGQLQRGGPARELADADGGDASTKWLQRGWEHGQWTQNGCAGFWHDAEWIDCTDGKARPVGPGSFPLGHGIQRRTSKLRAYGNAIVPQIAAEFIGAAMRSTQ